ncbi:transmembrane protein, putative [Medicago truncatula]|uniref:Transmembrane protein, putative n=1 Tax=Medicago truncatula TaxID=3880 RepID=G7IVM4_MEDTR|nr:transmembrane protein, putative [Medicago truncatula]
MSTSCRCTRCTKTSFTRHDETGGSFCSCSSCGPPNDYGAKGYNRNSKIMIYAKVLLFFNIILMLCLHIYARWYLLQSRHRRNRIRHRAQLVFFTDDQTNVVVTTVTCRIDATSSLLFPCYFTMRRIT